MLLQATEYNGTNINPGSPGYSTLAFPAATVIHPEGIPGFAARANAAPVFTYKGRKEITVPLTINLNGSTAEDRRDQYDAIKKLFDVLDNTLRKLEVKDTENSNKEWYFLCTPKSIGALDVGVIGGGSPTPGTVTIQLAVPDPIWYSVGTGGNEFSSSWVIDNSGDTHTLSPQVGGNVPAVPILEITPTDPRAVGVGFKHRRWIPIYNRTTNDFADYPLDIASASLNTSTLETTAANDSLVADFANKCRINNGSGITAGQTTIPYDTVSGAIPTTGMAYIENERISWTSITATELQGVTRGISGTAAVAHNDDTWIRVSKLQADGDDLRVYIDGVEANRWLQGINTANTKVWTVLNLSKKQEMTIADNLDDNDPIPTITLADSAANLEALSAIPAQGIVLIDDEAFSYTGKDTADRKSLKLTGCTRGVKGTSKVAHDPGDIARWIEHDVWIAYGDANRSAPATDDTQKPIIELTSTNTSWIYANFRNLGGNRAGSWSPAVIAAKSPNTRIYTAIEDSDEDPVAVMGSKIGTYQRSGPSWVGEAADLVWSLYHPAGVTEVASNGEKKRVTSGWPSIAALEKSLNNQVWSSVWNEGTPSGTNLETWTRTSSPSLGGLTYNYLRFRFAGGVGSGSNTQALFGVRDATLTLDGANVPNVSVGAEQDAYELDCKITNTSSVQINQVGGITSGATTIPYDTEVGTFPSSGLAYVDSEQISYTGKTATDLTGVTRGVNGTTAAAHADNAVINTSMSEYITLNVIMALGQTLQVDCLNKTVTLLADKSSQIAGLGWSSVRFDWFKLLPGTANQLQFDQSGTSGTSTVTLVTKWRDRNS